uniref:Uncharacterized protein n=1 Tax=Bathycoccus sp. RCC716 virus 2 TaxID=2530039 RepID=A0A7S6NYC2_9PHYC|nr:hypothetical protein [Bathycoccus sp. RCC716 virus 2]|tara:strand:- start:3867 stop:4484 length:618 start_codon:yes stop_codon:yes gene_type:complete
MATKFINAKETLKLTNYDGRKISLCTNEDKLMKIIFPRMYMPFGISGFTPEIGATKYNIDFAMKGWDEPDNFVKKFYECMREIEDKVIHAVSEQSAKIFNKYMTYEELKPMFNSNIKESPDREPKFRVKVDSTIDGKIKPHVYNEDKKPMVDDIKNGLYSRNSGTAIVEMNSVYFLNRKFGISWKLNSLVVYEPQRLKGFQFIGV